MHFKYVHFVLYPSYPREAIKMLCVLLPNCCEFVAQSCADAAVLSLFFPEVERRKENELGHFYSYALGATETLGNLSPPPRVCMCVCFHTHFAKVTFISDVNWPTLCLLTP